MQFAKGAICMIYLEIWIVYLVFGMMCLVFRMVHLVPYALARGKKRRRIDQIVPTLFVTNMSYALASRFNEMAEFILWLHSPGLYPTLCLPECHKRQIHKQIRRKMQTCKKGKCKARNIQFPFSATPSKIGSNDGQPRFLRTNCLIFPAAASSTN